MLILQGNPDFTLCELAEKLCVSVGRIKYNLKVLMYKGWFDMQNFQNSKKKI
jgi:hypothetical protein